MTKPNEHPQEPEKQKATKKKIDTNSLLKQGETIKDAAARRIKRVNEIDEQSSVLSEERRTLMDEYNHLERKLLRQSIEAQAKK